MLVGFIYFLIRWYNTIWSDFRLGYYGALQWLVKDKTVNDSGNWWINGWLFLREYFVLIASSNKKKNKNSSKSSELSFTLSQSIPKSWDWRYPSISMIFIHPSGAPRGWKNSIQNRFAGAGSGWMCLLRHLPIVKLLPVKELHNDMTNVSKVV